MTKYFWLVLLLFSVGSPVRGDSFPPKKSLQPSFSPSFIDQLNQQIEGWRKTAEGAGLRVRRAILERVYGIQMRTVHEKSRVDHSWNQVVPLWNGGYSVIQKTCVEAKKMFKQMDDFLKNKGDSK
jgi:hypothetical protein